MTPVRSRTSLPSSAPAAAASHEAVEGFDRFLSHVSHELRTPLSALLLWTRLFDEQQDPDRQREAVDAIKSSAQELQTLIEDLVDTSRVFGGRLQLNLQEVEPEPILRDAVEAVEPAAQDQEIVIDVDLGPLPVRVRADAHRLRQVIRNLLRHAMERTRPGGSVHLTADVEGNDVCLTVEDHGDPIPPERLARLFDHFGLAGAAGGARGTSAVGLATARHLVELQGAKLEAAAGPGGRGLVLTMHWPGVKAPTPAAAASPRPRPPLSTNGRPLRGKRVLLVEDSAETRRAIALVLADAGADVQAAGSSSVALAAFKKGPFDLLVSDLGLPKMDGYELIQQFRHWERAEHRPRITALALSAFASEGVKKRALQSGFDRYLAKPVDGTELVTALAEI